MSLQQRLNDYVAGLFSSYKPDTVRAYKVIHDSLWGTNLFRRHEIAVINTPLLQRLRQIRQTGFTFLTFPTVNHTRFEHSLGMVTVISRFAQKLNEKLWEDGSEIERISDDPKKGDLLELRLAALLHDCGHGLFSHVSEESYRWDRELRNLRLQDDFSHAKSSELLSYFIIKSEEFKKFFANNIADVYEVDVSLDRVADFVIGKAPPAKNFLANMINGTLDADKIDYISRDSLSSGVSTPIDIDRLFNELSVHLFPDGKTALVISSILPLERLLYSKVLLFASLYHHQKVKAADCMLHGLFEYVRESGILFKNVTFSDPVDFLHLTDHDVLDFHDTQNADSFVNRTIMALNRRELLKRCLVIRRDTVNNYESHVPYFVNRMSQSPSELRSLRQEILDRLPPGKRCSVHELWVCFPEQPSLREASQTLAILPGSSEPVYISEIFPTEGWLRAFSDNKWNGYVFGPVRLQAEICKAAKDVLTEHGFILNEKASAYAKSDKATAASARSKSVDKSVREAVATVKEVAFPPPKPATPAPEGVPKEGRQDKQASVEPSNPTTATEERRIDVDKVLSSMPLLRRFAKEASSSDRLKEFRFIIVLHFLEDLLGLMQAYKMAGMSPERACLLYKDYLYPSKDAITEQLRYDRFEVRPLKEMADVFAKVSSTCRERGEKLLIVEDGGYIVPLLHTKVDDPASICAGAVEQTTRGVRNDNAVEKLKIPILSVAQSEIKLTYESPEVAKTVVMNIRRLLREDNFAGRKALVIGYGSIGSHIAKQLRDAHQMIVAVHDSDTRRQTKASTEGFETFSSLTQALQRRFLVVGATGETTIGQAEIYCLDNDTRLVSASSDQREIGIEHLELNGDKQTIKGIGTRYKLTANTNEITLVADGFPVNFWGAESMPNRISDLVLTPIFLSTVELASKYKDFSLGISSEIVDKIVAEKKVIELFLQQQYSK